MISSKKLKRSTKNKQQQPNCREYKTIKNAKMNKTNGKSMDKTALVLVKKINMGRFYSTCRYPSQGNYRSL